MTILLQSQNTHYPKTATKTYSNLQKFLNEFHMKFLNHVHSIFLQERKTNKNLSLIFEKLIFKLYSQSLQLQYESNNNTNQHSKS